MMTGLAKAFSQDDLLPLQYQQFTQKNININQSSNQTFKRCPLMSFLEFEPHSDHVTDLPATLLSAAWETGSWKWRSHVEGIKSKSGVIMVRLEARADF